MWGSSSLSRDSAPQHFSVFVYCCFPLFAFLVSKPLCLLFFLSLLCSLSHGTFKKRKGEKKGLFLVLTVVQLESGVLGTHCHGKQRLVPYGFSTPLLRLKSVRYISIYKRSTAYRVFIFIYLFFLLLRKNRNCIGARHTLTRFAENKQSPVRIFFSPFVCQGL